MEEANLRKPDFAPAHPLADTTEKWDYSNPLPPSLSPEFMNAYIVGIQGRSYVKVEGLVSLLHLKGFRSITPELIQAPADTNGYTAIFKVTIEGYGWDPVKKEVIPITVVGHGDANAANCNKQVSPHFIRIAETRAIGRALRTYTNVNICTLEELDTLIKIEYISAEQMQKLKMIRDQYGIPKEKAREVMFNTVFKTEVPNLTLEEATLVITALQCYGETSTHTPGGTAPVYNPQQQLAPEQVTIDPSLDEIPGGTY